MCESSRKDADVDVHGFLLQFVVLLLVDCEFEWRMSCDIVCSCTDCNLPATSTSRATSAIQKSLDHLVFIAAAASCIYTSLLQCAVGPASWRASVVYKCQINPENLHLGDPAWCGISSLVRRRNVAVSVVHCICSSVVSLCVFVACMWLLH